MGDFPIKTAGFFQVSMFEKQIVAVEVQFQPLQGAPGSPRVFPGTNSPGRMGYFGAINGHGRSPWPNFWISFFPCFF